MYNCSGKGHVVCYIVASYFKPLPVMAEQYYFTFAAIVITGLSHLSNSVGAQPCNRNREIIGLNSIYLNIFMIKITIHNL